MHRLIKATCMIAAEDIGKVRAERIAAKAQKRYEELCWENASDSKALRAHTYARINPAIAVYEALRSDGMEQEWAVWISARKTPFKTPGSIWARGRKTISPIPGTASRSAPSG